MLAKAILNNKITQVALCLSCADAQGFEVTPGASPLSTGSIPGLRRALRCGDCGTLYSKFKTTGYLGCAQCYQAFRVPLAEVLTRIHGSCSHKGKLYVPGRSALSKNPALRRKMKKELAQALHREDFETAARLRDILEP